MIRVRGWAGSPLDGDTKDFEMMHLQDLRLTKIFQTIRLSAVNIHREVSKVIEDANKVVNLPAVSSREYSTL